MGLVVAPDDPRVEDVRSLLEQHLAYSREATPAVGVHALEVEGLLDPAITFFSARLGGQLLAVGALKELDEAQGELKSMHTDATARRRGVGRALVEHLLSVAAGRGYRWVSLETGTMEAFAPARSLYAAIDFRPTAGLLKVSPVAKARQLRVWGLWGGVLVLPDDECFGPAVRWLAAPAGATVGLD